MFYHHDDDDDCKDLLAYLIGLKSACMSFGYSIMSLSCVPPSFWTEKLNGKRKSFESLKTDLNEILMRLKASSNVKGQKSLILIKFQKHFKNSPTCWIGNWTMSCTRASIIGSDSEYISFLVIPNWKRSKFVAFWLEKKNNFQDFFDF